MTIAIGTICKVLVAELALVGLLSCVDSQVCFQISTYVEQLGAELTQEWLLHTYQVSCLQCEWFSYACMPRDSCDDILTATHSIIDLA